MRPLIFNDADHYNIDHIDRPTLRDGRAMPSRAKGPTAPSIP